MAKVVKVIELMSQSPKSWEDAAQGAVEEATQDTAERSLDLHQGIHR
jgi:flavin-binding protein dodecin